MPGKRKRISGNRNGGFFRPVKRRRYTARRRGSAMPRTGGFTNMEVKFFDTESTADAFATTWATMEPATTNLTAVGQGDGESQRDGRKYMIRSIHVRGQVIDQATESQTAPSGDGTVRFCLVWDTQTNGAQLTATDVMDGGQTNDIWSYRNLQFSKRFRILYDKTIVIPTGRSAQNEGAANLFASSQTQVQFKINKIFKKPIPVLMSGTTADIANVTDNSLHMIGVGDSTNTLLQYQCRVRFTG